MPKRHLYLPLFLNLLEVCQLMHLNSLKNHFMKTFHVFWCTVSLDQWFIAFQSFHLSRCSCFISFSFKKCKTQKKQNNINEGLTNQYTFLTLNWPTCLFMPSKPTGQLFFFQEKMKLHRSRDPTNVPEKGVLVFFLFFKPVLILTNDTRGREMVFKCTRE